MLLQDTLDVPMVFPGSADTRRTDPITSHMAADKTAATLTQVQAVVLAIFKARGNLTDSELNTHYELSWMSQGWPEQHPDSPRRRRSQLTARGLIVDSGEKRRNLYNSPEIVWVLATADNS